MIQLAVVCACATRLLQRNISCPSETLYYHLLLRLMQLFSLKTAEVVLLDTLLRCKVSKLYAVYLTNCLKCIQYV